ncbi:hypothetical protein F5884DRAFT_340186 [Xylogone sp. PMI_703]|nr:hypothetical protein F5884DRAFT_340186 [Xylogone sp. PMI_703]
MSACPAKEGYNMISTKAITRSLPRSPDYLEYVEDLNNGTSSGYHAKAYLTDHRLSASQKPDLGSGSQYISNVPDPVDRFNLEKGIQFPTKLQFQHENTNHSLSGTLPTCEEDVVKHGIQASSLDVSSLSLYDKAHEVPTRSNVNGITIVASDLLESPIIQLGDPASSDTLTSGGLKELGVKSLHSQPNNLMVSDAQGSKYTTNDVAEKPSIDITKTTKNNSLISVGADSNTREVKVSRSGSTLHGINPTHQPVQDFLSPKKVPGTSMEIYANEPIDFEFQQRFRILIDFFKRAVDNDPFLKLRTKDVNYDLRMCGKSPDDARPTIIVFCTEDIFGNLRKLLGRDSIKSQYARTTQRRFTPLLKKLQRDSTSSALSSSPVLPFRLVFWREIATPVKRKSAQEPVEAQIHSFLTMCGSLIRITHHTSTLSIVIRVDTKLYGMTVDHVRGPHGNDQGALKESTSDYEIESLDREGFDKCATDDQNDPVTITPESSEEEQEPEMANCEDFWIDDVEYDDLECDQDNSDNSDLGNVEKLPSDSFTEVTEEIQYSQSMWEDAGVLVHAAPKHDLSRPYLDWALIEFADKNYERLNALHSQDNSQPTKLIAAIAETPSNSHVQVIMISGATGFRKGILLPGVSYIGGEPGQKLCEALVVDFADSIGIVEGDCGSVVVHETTMKVYGHVVASNPLNQAYIVPIKDTLKQITDELGAKTTGLPDPLYSLAELLIKYNKSGQTDLAQRVEEIVASALKDKDVDVLSTFRTAVGEARVDIVEVLLDAGLDSLPHSDEEQTPLEIAAYLNQEKIVRLLLQRGCKPINGAARLAAEEGHLNVLRVLLGEIDEISEDRDTLMLNAISNFAFALENAGWYPESEELFRWIYTKMEKAFGLEYEYTLHSLNDLAHLLEKRGKYREAEEIHRTILGIRERILGLTHTDTLTSINNLAQVLEKSGKYEKSEKTHRGVLNLRIATLGREHRDTLTSYSNLAEVLERRGKYDEAVELNQYVLDQREKNEELGPDHQETLTSYNNLGQVLRSAGNLKLAESMAQRAVEGFQRTMGPDHPFTLTAMGNLALVLKSQSKFKEAERLYRHVLTAQEASLGPDHPSTLVSVANLSQLLQADERYEEAINYNRRALAGFEHALGYEHLFTITSRRDLGYLLRQQKKYAEAYTYCSDALEGYTKILGATDVVTLECSHSCSLLRIEMEQSEMERFEIERFVMEESSRIVNSRAIVDEDKVNERPFSFIGSVYGNAM